MVASKLLNISRGLLQLIFQKFHGSNTTVLSANCFSCDIPKVQPKISSGH